MNILKETEGKMEKIDKFLKTIEDPTQDARRGEGGAERAPEMGPHPVYPRVRDPRDTRCQKSIQVHQQK
jgi:hypothetical protein